MPESLTRLDRDGEVAIVTLNRPQRHNALIPDLLRSLLESLDHAARTGSNALVLQAAGPSFSTGGDLLWFYRERDRIAEYAEELVGLLNRCIMSLYTYPAPVVCAVHGQVTGGALGLLLAADRVIMHRDATVTPWYTAVGFSPDGGWTALLPELIGRRQALDWLLSNACCDARSCLALGLAQQVAEDDVHARAVEWVRNVSGGRSGSIRRTRQLLNGNAATLFSRLETERAEFVAQIQTAEARSGIEEFLEGKIR